VSTTVALPEAAAASGVVLVGNTSTPATGVTVSARGVDGYWGAVTTVVPVDAAGAFTFTRLPAGALEFTSTRCASTTASGCLAVERATTTVTLTPGQTATVTLRLFPQ
jgi:hypothetical protein